MLPAAFFFAPALSAQSAAPDDAALARASSPLLDSRLTDAVVEDAASRAEMRRVGFARACAILGATRRELGQRHFGRFAPVALAAIRRLIPADQLANARPLTFVTLPLSSYRERINDAMASDGAGVVAAAEADMRATYRTRLAALESTRDPSANVIVPRADIARVLAITGAWNLDNPHHVRMACAEQLIHPAQRPVITGGGPVPDSQRRD